MRTTVADLLAAERALALIDRVTGGDGIVCGDVLATLRELKRAGIVLDYDYVAELRRDVARITGAQNASKRD